MHILWLKTELLHPVDKGGKIRTYNMLRELKREHEITYLTLDDGSAPDDAPALAEEYCHQLIRVPHHTRPKFSAGFYAELGANLLSPLPYFMKKYQSAVMKSAIEQQLGERGFDVLVCDFLQPSVNLPDNLPVANVLFQHNVEAMIWKRHYEVQKNRFKKSYLFRQWRKTVNYERAACRRFDLVIAVSREDSETMQREYGLERVADVPTGVDTDYFRPRNDVVRQPHNLVFTGSMDWLPNEDAMQYFVKEILPLIKQKVPDVTVTVVGRNPYPSLIELAQKDPTIIVTGRVDDVRPFIDKADAYIVPLRIGGGTRLKIYEAMSMEKPVVSTSVGAEGLPLCDGNELLIRDTPELFADAVVRILTDETLAGALGARGAATVRGRFGWDRVAACFAEICGRANVPN